MKLREGERDEKGEREEKKMVRKGRTENTDE